MIFLKELIFAPGCQLMTPETSKNHPRLVETPIYKLEDRVFVEKDKVFPFHGSSQIPGNLLAVVPPIEIYEDDLGYDIPDVADSKPCYSLNRPVTESTDWRL